MEGLKKALKGGGPNATYRLFLFSFFPLFWVFSFGFSPVLEEFLLQLIRGRLLCGWFLGPPRLGFFCSLDWACAASLSVTAVLPIRLSDGSGDAMPFLDTQISA